MKKLNELGGLRAFRVDTITFEAQDTTTNCTAKIALPENFLPIALTGKIGTLLLPNGGSMNQNETQAIQFDYNIHGDSSYGATWTGWNADIGRLDYINPKIRIGTDKFIGSITSEGFEEVSQSKDPETGIITIIAKPDRPLYVIGLPSTVTLEY